MGFGRTDTKKKRRYWKVKRREGKLTQTYHKSAKGQAHFFIHKVVNFVKEGNIVPLFTAVSLVSENVPSI